MRLIAFAILLVGIAGVARADDKTTAAAFLARHGVGPQLAQAPGCANKCQVAESLGGAMCDIPTATGSGCVPVGTGCTCMGQLVGNFAGTIGGTAVRK
jgi:hypothetical protein